MRKNTRRGNGEFYIEKRGKNSFRVQVCIGNGKKKTVTAKTRALVIAKGKELEKQYSVGIDRSIKINEWLDIWLEKYINHLATNTRTSYKNSLLKHVAPKIGNIAMFELTPLHIQNMQSVLHSKSKLALSSISTIHSVLKKSLNDSVIAGIAYRNVMDAVKKPMFKKSKHTILTPDQVKRFTKRIETSKYKFAYLFMICNGLRKSEALGMEWDNVDLDSKSISIRKAVVPTNNGVEVGPTKTVKSRRTIPIPSFLVEKLSNELSKSQRGYVTKGKGKKPVTPGQLDYDFKKICAELNLKITPHELRHSCVAILLRFGVPMEEIQQLLGHSSIKITIDTYASERLDTGRKSAKVFDDLIGDL